MRRFILIDQSITEEGGHYLSYARAVLDSAGEEGFQPVLCVNRRYCSADGLPYRIFPAFSYTSLESMSTFRLRESVVDGGIKEYLWGGVVKPAVQYAARCAFGERYRTVRMRFPQKNRAPSAEEGERSYKAACFTRDLCALLSMLEISGDDVVFFPTVSIVELHGLEQMLRGMEIDGLPAFHLLFRWSPFCGRREEYDIERQDLCYTKDCLRSCADLHADGRLRFYTDSDRLSEQYNLFSPCKFAVLPIPHTEYPKTDTSGEKMVISYLGDARPEKGFLHLPGVVDALRGQEVQFRIQANFNIPGGEGGIRACRRVLRKKGAVTLYEKPLGADEYAHALTRTNIMLILYDPEQYYARSSGIFAEAMAAGIPALVPADTWMSAQVCKGRYEQLRGLWEHFHGDSTCMDLRSPVWVRRTGGVRHIILRLKADWTDCGNSMKVRALMRSAAGELLSEKVEFVEKDEGRDCLMQLPIPESCAKVSFEFSGTYGQTLPEFRLLESVELTGAVLLSGEICSIFDDIAQCGALLKDMIANYAQLRTSTEKFAQNWVDFHNATRLVKLLS